MNLMPQLHLLYWRRLSRWREVLENICLTTEYQTGYVKKFA
jgi:hypothetical protein